MGGMLHRIFGVDFVFGLGYGYILPIYISVSVILMYK